ncbi:MAG TPA: hypothetical protein VNU92_16570 [Edaphobacter sp.]|jgi:hypothetical protein|nr:hypothetical protein [Edaphobacter sp.]
MHVDPILLRNVVLVVLLLLVFGGRLTKGSMRQSPDGLVFGTKPIIIWTRIIALPALILFIVASTMHQTQTPWFLYLFIVAAVVFLLVQLPGTITLTPTAITQRFWFRPLKSIQYKEVMAIQSVLAGRAIRVLGDNRVKITHTVNHCANAEFVQELERRTGKRVIV